MKVHQILKNIVTIAINHPSCSDLARFMNLRSEMVANAAATLGACGRMVWVEGWAEASNSRAQEGRGGVGSEAGVCRQGRGGQALGGD